MTIAPFGEQELAQFRRDGWVVGRRMFARETAIALRDRILEETSSNRGPDGWKQSVVMSYDAFTEADWEQVTSPRLRAAVDALAGPGRWMFPKRFGSWPVLFPGFCKPPWRPIEMTWHIEGREYQHFLGDAGIAVTMILLCSDIGPGDGGTAILPGSHHGMARILAEAAEGLSQMRATGLFLDLWSSREAVAVEATGRAGDVLFMHPYAVHTTSTNIGSSIRVGCNARAMLKQRMNLDPGAPGNRTLVEWAVVDALSGTVGEPTDRPCRSPTPTSNPGQLP